jgi:hypothetical protein
VISYHVVTSRSRSRKDDPRKSSNVSDEIHHDENIEENLEENIEKDTEGREAHLDMMMQNITFPTHVQVFTSGQGIGIINFAPKYSTCQSRQQERSPWR